ncbi:gag/pol protein [Cucumis melo var. makuwa]|uniref:Gag/pol protein n=1 Tax=Cucumis melo var. makuwa TaxID=1194695 RepID=A0A5D3C5N8_CUCMM|nr:gag/pol protein [Cucumis melo var. makuwa]TYK06468.1 gag/pol protein [Cucumis melo var. makuwa]
MRSMQGFASCIRADSLRRMFAWVKIKECPQTPASNANRTSRKAYDRWVKANEKARVYILASVTDVLAKKQESLATTKEIMDALKAMFEQPEWSLRHEAIKYIYTKRMKEGTYVREHVLDMMMHFNIAEVNGGAIDEANQENSSLKRLSEGEITLKVGTGEMVSTEAVGDLKIERLVKTGLLKHRIQIQFSAPNTPQQNGVSERRNPILLDMVRSMMSFAQLLDSFWGYALETAVYILNNVPSTSVSETPYELWKGRTPYQGSSTSSKLVLNEISKSATNKPSSSTKVVDKTKVSGQTHPSQELRELRRSGRVVHQPNRYSGLSESHVVIPDDGIEDPITYKQVMNDINRDQWIKAMNLEIESMFFNSVWTLVDQSNNVKSIGCKWIYKRKRDQAGKVQTFKARLVPKDYTQREGVDYEETFSPVVMLKSIRILLSTAVFYDYEIWQMDVKTAFLNGNLEESIYMAQVEGFIKKGQEQKVSKLQKSIYGLKPASRS